MVMGLRPEHELHRRRSGRNVGLGIVLALFVALVFTLSIVKVRQGDMMQGFDHRPAVPVAPADLPGPAANPVAVPGTPGADLPNARPAPVRP